VTNYKNWINKKEVRRPIICLLTSFLLIQLHYQSKWFKTHSTFSGQWRWVLGHQQTPPSYSRALTPPSPPTVTVWTRSSLRPSSCCKLPTAARSRLSTREVCQRLQQSAGDVPPPARHSSWPQGLRVRSRDR